MIISGCALPTNCLFAFVTSRVTPPASVSNKNLPSLVKPLYTGKKNDPIS